MAFRYLDYDAYSNLTKRIDSTREKRDQYTREVKRMIQEKIDEYGLKGVVEGRAKHFWSIHKKMHEQKIDFDEVYDLTAFRIILDSDKEKDCYEALSIVHALWIPVPRRFKDYIAMPKANNYRSLHTTVIGPSGQRVEIQIRTKEMHEWAEEGIAAHWRYKEKRMLPGADEEQIRKLRELLEIQQDLKNPREFMTNLKLALFPDEVYVFTPDGDVRSFPKGATPIDFAYSIHTDVGHTCVGAKVNRSIVPLKYELKNGDAVEIITQAGHHPSKDWLKYAVTSRARSKIKGWVKAEESKKSITLGRELLEKEFRKNSLKLSSAVKSDEIRDLFTELSINTPDDLFALVGYGRVSPKRVVHHFIHDEISAPERVPADRAAKRTKKEDSQGILITGIEDIMVRFAHCCDPIPGDEIVGYITRGRGVTIHTADCERLSELDSERFVDVAWSAKASQTYSVNMVVTCKDKKGILAEISSVISSLDVNISTARVDTSRDMRVNCFFRLDVTGLRQLQTLTSAIQQIKEVLSVERVHKVKEHPRLSG